MISFITTRLATRNDEGATAVEYGLMVALIAVAIVVTVGLLGEQLNTLFTSVTDSLTPAA
ncbi:MAG: Flp family type IVb pilin [Propionicimonas sp.]